MRDDPAPSTVEPVPGPSAAGAAVHALRVLVVDDSAPDRQLFEYLLEDFRALCPLAIECELARSGPQALRRLAESRFDLLVLDQNMPEMSGTEVLAALPPLFRGLGRTRPRVLAYSTCDTPEFRHQCLIDGADAFCSKYLTPADLARVLRELDLDRGGAA